MILVPKIRFETLKIMEILSVSMPRRSYQAEEVYFSIAFFLQPQPAFMSL